MELCHDASYGPYIDFVVVFAARTHHLWGSIPSGDNVFGEVILRGSLNPSGEPKVTYLEVTVSIQKNIAGFQIAMHDPRGMNILEAS